MTGLAPVTGCEIVALPWAAGVDGCRAGWFVVLVEIRSGNAGEPQHVICPSFKDTLRLLPRPRIIAVDVPMGLLTQRVPGGRNCDQGARELLGAPRASSVFTPPIRGALNATSYENARQHGMSKQTFAILPKIREVDALMTPELQETVREVHPEICFWALAGHPMEHSKRTPRGKNERLEGLAPEFPGLRDSLQSLRLPGVGQDDILDAYAAAWTAIRILNSQAKRIPEEPGTDEEGLRMEIWY